MYTPKSTKGTSYLKSLIQKRNELKENYTECEKLLWFELKQAKLGYSFRRQHIVSDFIVDFYCVEKCLAVEVDGEVHDMQKIRDRERDHKLSMLGISMLRFTNDQVKNNIEFCLERIRKALSV